MSKPKQHHYIPRFYLENFCKDGILWIYDRELKEFREQTPDNTCKEKDLYTAQLYDGSKYYEIESFYSMLESLIKPIVSKLHKKNKLDIEEHATLCLYVPFMMFRVPTFMKMADNILQSVNQSFLENTLSDIDTVKDMIEHYEKTAGNKFNISAEQVVDMMKNKDIYADTNKGHSIAYCIKIARELYYTFWNLQWHFNWSPKDYNFITSDNPITVVPPPGYIGAGRGILTPKSLRIIPISPNCCVILLDPNKRYRYQTLKKSVIRSINESIAVESTRFVIAKDERHLKKIVKTVNI